MTIVKILDTEVEFGIKKSDDKWEAWEHLTPTVDIFYLPPMGGGHLWTKFEADNFCCSYCLCPSKEEAEKRMEEAIRGAEFLAFELEKTRMSRICVPMQEGLIRVEKNLLGEWDTYLYVSFSFVEKYKGKQFKRGSYPLGEFYSGECVPGKPGIRSFWLRMADLRNTPDSRIFGAKKMYEYITTHQKSVWEFDGLRRASVDPEVVTRHQLYPTKPNLFSLGAKNKGNFLFPLYKKLLGVAPSGGTS